MNVRFRRVLNSSVRGGCTIANLFSLDRYNAVALTLDCIDGETWAGGDCRIICKEGFEWGEKGEAVENLLRCESGVLEYRAKEGMKQYYGNEFKCQGLDGNKMDLIPFVRSEGSHVQCGRFGEWVLSENFG